ncbi:MAG: hypothetical protein U5K43_12830 [Halofilum sp. (in: g-proteobacteria)]|nr:hypothetical protein [Halofilum sp. (in: g-proteobacteria)]
MSPLAATLSGTPAAHRLEVELRSARGDADLALAGSWPTPTGRAGSSAHA